MNVLLVLCSVVAISVVALILLPFIRGEGGFLQDASSEDSLARLESRRTSILKRWLDEERAAHDGLITAREWSMRQVYLTNRYVDAVRRMDWLQKEGKGPND